MSEPTTPVDETLDPATPVAVRTARIALGIGTRVTAVQVSMSPVTADGLLESAQRHATRGLRARVAEEHDDACLQLGTMIEHLAKAYLASLDPTLVMESKFNLLSLLQLAGHAHRVKPGHVLKTVGVYEALTRIGTILNSNRGDAGQVFAARFAVVVDARNGVAHIGNAGSSVDEVAQLAVVFADEVLTLMGRQLADLFGPFTDAVEDLRQKCGTEVERRVKLLIAEAKQVFSRTYGEPDTPAAVEQLARIDRSTTGVLQTEHSQVAHSCPAC